MYYVLLYIVRSFVGPLLLTKLDAKHQNLADFDEFSMAFGYFSNSDVYEAHFIKLS